jgi:hypothetical protein
MPHARELEGDEPCLRSVPGRVFLSIILYHQIASFNTCIGEGL